MLGTTQCTNAIVERKHLEKIAIIRIGAPATAGIPPMVDWPADIQQIVADAIIIGGGYEYDGKEIAPLDEEAAPRLPGAGERKSPFHCHLLCILHHPGSTMSAALPPSVGKCWVRIFTPPSPVKLGPWV